MKRRLLWLVVFAVAMGYLEAAVVVYLRRLFYPEGFAFPLKQISIRVGAIEIAREAATLAMLIGISFATEATRRARLACLMLIFGIWDITYYLWLWVTVGWPESLLTWDVLFLIPVIWTGPVLAPVLVSIAMIGASLLYYLRGEEAERVHISKPEWVLVVASAVTIFISFALNHSLVFEGGIPQRFHWEIFLPGLGVGLVVLARIARRITWVFGSSQVLRE